MAELSKVQFFTPDGIVTATVLDTVGPDRIMLHLIKGSHAARMATTDDKTESMDRSVKNLIVSPFTTSSS
ncbi:MAG: hypothetical protein CMH53_09045 [Myxococcales bacterium]|nr:hypothetical protein [Myxococcales bacterium]